MTAPVPNNNLVPFGKQNTFFNSTHPETGFVTGFAGGKSWILILRMLATKLKYPTVDLCYISPTHSITRDVLYPLIDELLQDTGIQYRIHKQENTIYFINPPRGKILCKSADDPGKIVGFTVGDVFVDEIDTLTQDKADHLWTKALGRMRAKFPLEKNQHSNKKKHKQLKKLRKKYKRDVANQSKTDYKQRLEQFDIRLNEVAKRTRKRNQIFCSSTPEGYLFLWKHFEKEPNKNKKLNKSRLLIQGSTRDNPHLPAGFIQTLLDNYPPELVDAYLDGKFVSLNAGRVYKHYDPNLHSTTLTLRNFMHDIKQLQKVHKESQSLNRQIPLEIRIVAGQDFNMDGNVTIVLADDRTNSTLYALKELVGKDTRATCTNLHKEINDVQSPRLQANKIVVYPDSSGHNRATNATKTDIALITDSGFRVKARQKNPDIRDRVNSVNSLFYQNRIYVNQEECPELHSALLQQIYNDKTGQPEKTNKPASPDDYTDSFGYVCDALYPLLSRKMYCTELGGF